MAGLCEGGNEPAGSLKAICVVVCFRIRGTLIRLLTAIMDVKAIDFIPQDIIEEAQAKDSVDPMNCRGAADSAYYNPDLHPATSQSNPSNQSNICSSDPVSAPPECNVAVNRFYSCH
ncbi:hypothetical protein ANN_13247 [Periplaneta americana]|uniref:Uncharacterized protein n=1 Tax=Periplaneta americana TaxID=6978 RepID=A0ABQ8TMD1_PERAM|nr:hypothetical protein ANN_13247 [Periplaneta americana]